MNAKAAAQAKVDAALSKLAPAIRDAFLDAIARHGSSVDLGALVAALERGDIYAAAATLEMPQTVLYPVTEAIRSGYIAAGAAVANDLPLYIRATFGFGQNPRAVAAVQRITAEFITNVVEAQREATREVITALVNEGIPARQAALSIVGKINPLTGLREGGYLGLDVPRAQQAARVQAMLNDPAMIKNYFLPNGQPRYKTTDRRFDKTVRAAIASGKALTKEQSEKITKAHRARLLKNRADTISRTEGLNALRAGERAGFQQLVDSGAVPDSRVIREWIPTKDARTRHDHVAMTGQIHRGMAAPFVFPDGDMAMFPGDVSLGAKAENTILCRCMMSYRIARQNSATREPSQPKAYPAGMSERDDALREDVVRQGVADGLEHLAAYDRTGKQYTNDGSSNFVGIAGELEKAMKWRGSDVVIHHNHPTSMPLSKQDLAIVGEYPGAKTVYAHGHDGSIFRVDKLKYFALRHVNTANQEIARTVMSRRSEFASEADMNRLFYHVAAANIAAKGYVKYSFNLAGKTADAYSRNKALVDAIIGGFAK